MLRSRWPVSLAIHACARNIGTCRLKRMLGQDFIYVLHRVPRIMRMHERRSKRLIIGRVFEWKALLDLGRRVFEFLSPNPSPILTLILVYWNIWKRNSYWSNIGNMVRYGSNIGPHYNKASPCHGIAIQCGFARRKIFFLVISKQRSLWTCCLSVLCCPYAPRAQQSRRSRSNRDSTATGWRSG